MHIYRNIYKFEGVPALFKGLGPTLVGVIPARSINFFTYGNGKQIIANKFNHGAENSWVHLSAAAFAGIVTGTATNPIWVVKTRMQLSASQARPYTSSWVCIKDILKTEGVRGMYKGLSASYLGVTEGTIQWTLYERLKRVTRGAEGQGGFVGWFGMLGSAGMAKCIASLLTYPHEVRSDYAFVILLCKCLRGFFSKVIRTRLRQPPINGIKKYTGLYQTLQVIIAEEGVGRLYGGLSAHLLRVVPNAAVMFSIYEGILWWGRHH